MPSIPEDKLVWPLFEHLMQAHIKRVNGIAPNVDKATLIKVYADKKFSIGELVIELEPFIRQYAAKERIAERKLVPHAEYCELNYAHVPVECNCGRNERIKQLKKGSIG